MEQTSGLDWGQFETILRNMYLEQNMTLGKIMDEMSKAYQFNATKAQYELQFRKWQFRKNGTAEDWKIITEKFAIREAENKKTEIVFNGKPLHSKKIKKQTMRYGPSITTLGRVTAEKLPSTPEGFIIRTPPPTFTSPKSIVQVLTQSLHEDSFARESSPPSFPTSITSRSNLVAHSPLPVFPPTPVPHDGTSPVKFTPVLIDHLPFQQFLSVFSQQDNPFLHGLDDGKSLIKFPLENVLLKELKGIEGDKLSHSFNETIQSIVPEDTYSNNLTSKFAISPSPVVKFLELTLYLISNNFFGSESEVGDRVYEWIQRHSYSNFVDYIASIGGVTVEALFENLFRLAIDYGDVSMVKKILSAGVNPSDASCYNLDGSSCTPLERACEMGNLEVVRTLIFGGAKVDTEGGKSILMTAVDYLDEDFELREHIEPELVEILLAAGARVNPGSGLSPLACALKWGHFEVVKLLVSGGADVNFVLGTSDGITDGTETPIFGALYCHQYYHDSATVMSMIRFILDAGADVNSVSIADEVLTVLERSMYNNDIELTRILLERGARVTEKSLEMALQHDDINMVKLLADFGGQITESVIDAAFSNHDYNINGSMLASLEFLLETGDNRIKSDCKTSILTQCIATQNIDLARRLCESGAELKSTPSLKNAIEKAVQKGGIEIFRFLLDEKSRYRNPTLESLDNTLFIAIKHDKNDIAQLLIKAGANVKPQTEHAQDIYGLDRSPLLAAIKKQNWELTVKLLDASAPVNGMDRGYNTVTVLPAVVAWGNYPLVQRVISSGAEVNSPEKEFGKTALSIAVQKNDRNLINLLLDSGADVNTPEATLSGTTALNAAVQAQEHELVQYLLGLGAEPDEMSLVSAVSWNLESVQMILAERLTRYKQYNKCYGCRALQRAIKLQDGSIIELLLSKGVDANVIVRKRIGDTWKGGLQEGMSALGYAAKLDKSKDSWLLKIILEGGADPDSLATDDCQTSLLVAIQENNFGTAKALIEAGADTNPNLQFGIKRTPLQLAVEKCRTNIVDMLLENGADVNAPAFARYGATALQFAAIGGFIGLARLLITHGADINAPPAKIGGRTALEGAAEHGRIDILQLLLTSGALIIDTGETQYNRARELALKNGHRAACHVLEKFNEELFNTSMLWDEMSLDL